MSKLVLLIFIFLQKKRLQIGVFPDEYYKFTDMEGNRDAYIIKGDTLYPVLKNGKSLIEYLYAIPKPGPELGLYNRGIYFGPKKDK